MSEHVRQRGRLRSMVVSSRGRIPSTCWTAIACAFTVGVPLPPAVGRPQDPAAKTSQTKKDEGKPAVDAPQAPAVDLAARYHLVERYTVGDKALEGAIGQYQVAFRDTLTETTEKAQGAPTRREIVQHARYLERAADVRSGDDSIVTDVVRRYETVRITPDSWAKQAGPKPLDELTIYLHSRIGEQPEIFSMTPNRSLLEQEYRFASGQMFVPSLAQALPSNEIHLGGTWPLSRAAIFTLLGLDPSGGTMVAKLSEVREDPKGVGQKLAIIDVAGRVTTVEGDTVVRAQLLFRFVPALPKPTTGAAEPKAEESIVEALGGIDRVSLASVATRLLGDGGNLRHIAKREFILERKRPGEGPALLVPNAAPMATPENSWLTFIDPSGQFHFRHPQEFQPDFREQPVAMALVHPREGGDDVIRLEFAPKEQLKPEVVFKSLTDRWRDSGSEVQVGATRKLAVADFPGMIVHHIEAVSTAPVRAARGGTRMHFDGYVAQFTQNASLFVGVTTFQDSPLALRKQAAEILKTFKLGVPADFRTP